MRLDTAETDSSGERTQLVLSYWLLLDSARRFRADSLSATVKDQESPASCGMTRSRPAGVGATGATEKSEQ